MTQDNVDSFRFDLLGVFPLSTVNQWGTDLTSLYPDRNLLLYGEPWTAELLRPVHSTLGMLEQFRRLASVPSMALIGAIKGTDDNAGGKTGFLFDQTTSDSFFGAYQPGQTWPSNGEPGYGPISLGFAASAVQKN